MPLFVVMFLVLRVLYAILGIVRALALLRFLILPAVFILRFALLVLCLFVSLPRSASATQLR